ncbi:hypothetical protein BS50DRAFT_579030 [Corynespora cassiicola Philippines]|uniref:Uncharacterized protein n=1 Tax=Corynespora cassiicola Philippines TaxID=1448308 RepID=A0A2T2N4V5_CORCC|nr:hypothetical protein BS50DRAFT_579030 [Corynespora cassiicola Philippines]
MSQQVSDVPSLSTCDNGFILDPTAPYFDPSPEWMALFDDTFHSSQTTSEDMQQKIIQLENKVQSLRGDVDTLENWIKRIYSFLVLKPVMMNTENGGGIQKHANQDMES